ncbi:hypothetical protein NBRC116599_06700 [Aquicoccus sp. SU-CL01552]
MPEIDYYKWALQDVAAHRASSLLYKESPHLQPGRHDTPIPTELTKDAPTGAHAPIEKARVAGRTAASRHAISEREHIDTHPGCTTRIGVSATRNRDHPTWAGRRPDSLGVATPALRQAHDTKRETHGRWPLLYRRRSISTRRAQSLGNLLK